jgi:hypothetical protein
MTSPSYVCLVPFPPSNPDPPVDALYHGPLPQSQSIRVRQGPSPPIVTPFLAPVVLVVGSLHSIDTATTCCAHRYLSRKGIYTTLGSRSRAPAPVSPVLQKPTPTCRADPEQLRFVVIDPSLPVSDPRRSEAPGRAPAFSRGPRLALERARRGPDRHGA